jgi:hypothetical protein
MRPVRIIATVIVVAALAGCASRSADQPGTSSSGASSVTTTQPTAASTGSTTATVTSPATATCAVSPKSGPAGSRVTLTCRGFAPSEQVDVSFGAVVVATATASAGGEVVALFAVPSGFAGSHYPGRKDTFQAKGRHSGTVASATFTVTG